MLRNGMMLLATGARTAARKHAGCGAGAGAAPLLRGVLPQGAPTIERLRMVAQRRVSSTAGAEGRVAEELSEMDEHMIPLSVARRVLRLSEEDVMTEKAVKTAYRSRALELHPDRNRDDAESAMQEFKYVQRCYAVAMRAAQHLDTVTANAAGRDAWKESMRRRKGGRKPLKKKAR